NVIALHADSETDLGPSPGRRAAGTIIRATALHYRDSDSIRPGVLAMSTMRAVQVSRPGGPLELVERPIPDPGPGQVRIKVQACGICHSDALVKDGVWPGLEFPRVPGHEVIGVIDQVGRDVPSRWVEGMRVGIG